MARRRATRPDPTPQLRAARAADPPAVASRAAPCAGRHWLPIRTGACSAAEQPAHGWPRLRAGRRRSSGWRSSPSYPSACSRPRSWRWPETPPRRRRPRPRPSRFPLSRSRPVPAAARRPKPERPRARARPRRPAPRRLQVRRRHEPAQAASRRLQAPPMPSRAPPKAASLRLSPDVCTNSNASTNSNGRERSNGSNSKRRGAGTNPASERSAGAGAGGAGPVAT